MLSDTLIEQIDAYRIGPKIHQLRTDKRLGLAQLGEHTGLSAGMLSKIERGVVVPTLPTLVRISLVFGVGLDHFFTPEDARPTAVHVRAEDRIKLPIDGQEGVSYLFESLDFPVPDRLLEAYLAEFPETGRPSKPHAHKGVELVYVIEGQIALTIHGRRHLLVQGDAFYFDADYDHQYENATSEGGRARALVAVAPHLPSSARGS
ncbi:cupin domain-containing protein [Aliiroseovarius crassostreae]|uniref:cupin domain-containing protein n=1 Tax=Aliiroseovarius crassostreae TaxID=154981 RepID=UPI0022060DA0|nr:cupin domain-containing protein [Aliiroseovarius crassostreae]UWP90103.1 cupin domain-containing protein [Aliiroseovarius crassostreae]UWQ02754.1 cupin domain-containing protein [Aliiroseovarius crassostreae]